MGEGDIGRGEELDGLGSVWLGEADWCGERSLTGEVRIGVMSGVYWGGGIDLGFKWIWLIR